MTGRVVRDPAALRRSVTDRLATFARAERRVNLNDLLRQLAYDRLLCRIFTGPDRDRWVLEGAAAMLVRVGSDGRHTLDVDLYRRSGGLDEAEEALRAAAARDIGDLFRFEASPGRPVGAATETRRVRMTAYLGATRFASFPVDLVTALDMTGEAEEMGPFLHVATLGLPTTAYRVYPLADHIADKVCALHETHERPDGSVQPSTRYRDLVDLTVFARTTPVDAQSLIRALRSEGRRRRVNLPSRVTVPSTPDWPAGYSREVRNAPGAVDRTLDAAAQTVRRFIDPVLRGTAAGVWDPQSQSWSV